MGQAFFFFFLFVLEAPSLFYKRLTLSLSLLVLLVLLFGRSSGSLYFVFLLSLRLASLPTTIYRRIFERRIRRLSRFGYIGVISGMHGVTLSRSFGEEREQRRFHHRFCIQTYAKGREFCFDFRARFLFFFFLSSYFFSFFFPHVTRLFGSIAFYFNLVNPPFTAARNDSFPLEKARTNRLAILARIFSKFGSVVNVFRFI